MHRTAEIISQASHLSDYDSVYQAICADAAEKLDINRVSLWYFDDDFTKITAACCFDTETAEYSKGQILEAKDFPPYFETILTEKIIIAPDVSKNRATKCLVDAYFNPNNIISLLDFVLLDKKKHPQAVLCCENCHSLRNWTKDDIQYLQSLTTLASFHLLGEGKGQ